MRQLIARIDERLHRQLKERAAVQRRSMNSLVTDLLERGLEADDRHGRLRARMRELGVLVELPRPRGRVPPRDEVRRLLRGDAGRALVEALEEARGERR
ncbi:MAG: toxin-antitoxin system HicB family antitoxin [Chloroflexota bacterium]|nr:toxin-antitoxin system HicB family antitoxin [Chloroflexota bacterium]MDE3102756.1 toxin-antitoxin system HicB family antitoxin [Chloroflexota bacterium]